MKEKQVRGERTSKRILKEIGADEVIIRINAFMSSIDPKLCSQQRGSNRETELNRNELKWATMTHLS